MMERRSLIDVVEKCVHRRVVASVILIGMAVSLVSPLVAAASDAAPESSGTESVAMNESTRELYRLMFEGNVIDSVQYHHALEHGSLPGDGALPNAAIPAERQTTWNDLHAKGVISAEELVQMLGEGQMGDLSPSEMKAFEELAPVYEPNHAKRLKYDIRRKHIAVDMIRFRQTTGKKWRRWKEEAELKANRIGLPVREEGAELVRFNARGVPYYDVVDNAESAAALEVPHLQPGGSSGFDLTGTNITVATWDIGIVRETHREFGGRVSQEETSPTHTHSTRVAGTLCAMGVTAAAKGMASAVNVDVHYYNDMIDELPAYVQTNNTCQLSNHSYGLRAGWTESGTNWYWDGDITISSEEDGKFGRYESESRAMDEFCYLNPYHLPVFSAGNDTAEGPPSGTVHQCWDVNLEAYVTRSDYHPPDGHIVTNGITYHVDTLDPRALAKNILTVGSCKRYTTTNGYVFLSSSFSSVGQTDDWRIKPDVLAKGSYVETTDSAYDSAYIAVAGTSFSAPAVAGSLALIQEWHERLYGTEQPMLSSTLKLLPIHTARDLGPYDPDRVYGYGLPDMLTGAQIVTNNAAWLSLPHIKEVSLPDGCEATWQTYYSATNGEPLRVSIGWTDPPGPLHPLNEIDPTNSVLVNDLDLRVYGPDGSTNFPWRLEDYYWRFPGWPLALPGQGDNDRDNVEQVVVENPTNGWYTIGVTHKGSLTNGVQVFSAIITGNTPTNAPDFLISEVGVVSSNDVVQLAWPGVVGGLYEVEASTNLLDHPAGWSSVGDAVGAYQQSVIWTNSVSTDQRQFFRIRRLW